MPAPIRKHATYANITATLALLFAMSGGALAATHYLVVSANKQISPHALAEIKAKAKGATGAAGPAGTNGTSGTSGKNGENGERGIQGEKGVQGVPGPTVKELASGQSEHGVFGIHTPESEPEGFKYAAISLPIPLPETLEEANVHFVELGESGGKDCEDGTFEEPKAAPGNLCIYLNRLEGAVIGIEPGQTGEAIFNPEAIGPKSFGVGRAGGVLAIDRNTTSEPTNVDGGFVVTAK